MSETPLYTARDIKLDFDKSTWDYVAVLPDGRRILLADVRCEGDYYDGWDPTCDPRYEDGSPLSDDERDEFDSWLRDVCGEILNSWT